MTVFRPGRNGPERNEARREDEIITPRMLAKMISKEVGKQLKGAIDDASARSETLIRQAVQQLAIGVGGHVSRRMAEAIEQMHAKFKETTEAVLAVAQRCHDETTKALTLNTHKFLEIMKENSLANIKAVRKCGVETLRDIIGEEVQRYRLEELIRQEIQSAVHDAVRQILKSPSP